MGQQNKKNVRMVLYRVHDYDLIQYYVSLQDRKLKNPKISFSYVMKGLLKDFVRNEHNFSAPIIKKFSDKKMPSKIYVRFTLDKTEDADILAFLGNIKDRQTNSFLKSLLRRQLDVRGLRCYFEGEGESGKTAFMNAIIEEFSYNKSALVIQESQEIDISELKPVRNIEETKEESPIQEKKPVVVEQIKIQPEEKAEDVSNEVEEEQTPSFDFFGNLGNINQI